MAWKVDDVKSIMLASGVVRSAPHMQRVEDQRASLPRGLSPYYMGCLGFFGEPLWSCDCAASGAPFAKAGKVGRTTNVSRLEPPSAFPLPPAVFLHVALFLTAEDVTALASVCRDLRWLAFSRDIWRSLCFSEQLVSRTPGPSLPRRRFARMNPGASYSHTTAVRLFQPPHSLHRRRLPLSRSKSGCVEFCVSSSSRRNQMQKQEILCRTDSFEEAHSLLPFSEQTDGHVERHEGSDPAAESVERRGLRVKPKSFPGSEAYTDCETRIHCRGLQVLPGYSCELHSSLS